MELDKDIRQLMKEVIVKELDAQKKGSTVTQGDANKATSKAKKSLIEILNDADKNLIESRKADNEKERNDIERERIENEKERNVIERMKVETEKEIECEKLKFERERLKIESDIEYEKLTNERLKIESEKNSSAERSKYEFYGKVITAMLLLAETTVSLVFLNKWTQWGFIQEEFGSIAGKTMSNVMRNWRVKRI